MPSQPPESPTCATEQAAASEPQAPERKLRHAPTAVVLTALEVEFEAMRAHLTNVESTVHPNGTYYDVGALGRWSVALAEIGAGNSQASMEVERAVQHFSAQVVMFVGVAGGVKDVALGDVVVAEKVVGYERGKDSESFRPRADSAPCSYRAVQLARAIRRESNRETGTDFHTYIGSLAAGEKVVGSMSSATADLLRANYGDVLAVEMEGRGFLVASAAQPGVDAIVVRGISDLLDGKQATDAAGGQLVAARNAARIAAALLKRLLPVEEVYLAESGKRSELDSPPTGWEYDLLTRRISEAIDAVASRRRDLVLGVPGASVTTLEPTEFLARFRSELAMLQKWTSTVNPLLNDFLPEAVGLPGVPGDAGKIAYVAERLGRAYSEVIDWGVRWRSVAMDESWGPVLQQMANSAISLAGDFERFRDSLVVLMGRIADGSIETGSEIRITLDLRDPGLDGIVEAAASLLGVDEPAAESRIDPVLPDVRVVAVAGQILRPGAPPEDIVSVTAANHSSVSVYLAGGVSATTDDPEKNMWLGVDAQGQHLYARELRPGDSVDIVILASELAPFARQIQRFFYTDKLGRRFCATVEGTAKALAELRESPT